MRRVARTVGEASRLSMNDGQDARPTKAAQRRALNSGKWHQQRSIQIGLRASCAPAYAWAVSVARLLDNTQFVATFRKTEPKG